MSSKRIILLLSLFMLFTQCEKRNTDADDTFFKSKVMILGHRGMGTAFYKPGNTEESILTALHIGTDGCELDIQMSSDSVLVLFHDAEMSVGSSCFGHISEHTWEEIRKCEYISLHNNIFILSVEELFQQIPDLHKYYFSFDCKINEQAADPELYRRQFFRAVKRICDKYNMSEQILIEGNLDQINTAQQLGLTNKMFLTGDMSDGNIKEAVDFHCYGMSIAMDLIGENIHTAHAKGLRIMAYSPNTFSQNKEALSKHADIIQTDDPISLLKYLDRYNYE